MSRDKDLPIIFDLDGTLVDTDAFDGRLYVQAVRGVLGDVDIDESWTRYRHVTDAGVLEQIIDENGLSDAATVKAEVRQRFGTRVENYFRNGGACDAIRGAASAFGDLVARGYRVGIATGGWGHTARMKLAHAQIPTRGIVLVSSDDSASRVTIMKTCVAKRGGTGARPLYIGDAVWDLAATVEAGWSFVGVGPKRRGRCDTWIEDFMDPSWRALHNCSFKRTQSQVDLGAAGLMGRAAQLRRSTALCRGDERAELEGMPYDETR